MKKITEEENKVRSNVYKTYYTDYVIRANGCERACFTTQLWYLKQIRKADAHLEKYVNQL
jgi:hypothetical protein